MADQTKETPETLQRQVAETLPLVTGSEKPITPPELQTLVEDILEETLKRQATGPALTAEQQTKAAGIVQQALEVSFKSRRGNVYKFGANAAHVYLDAARVFSVADWVPGVKRGLERNSKTGLAFWKEVEDGPVKIFSAQAWAECTPIGSSTEGVVGRATTEDKFLRGNIKSKGQHGFETALISKAQKQALRKAIVQILGLDEISEVQIKELGKKIGVEIPIVMVQYGSD